MNLDELELLIVCPSWLPHWGIQCTHDLFLQAVRELNLPIRPRVFLINNGGDDQVQFLLDSTKQRWPEFDVKVIRFQEKIPVAACWNLAATRIKTPNQHALIFADDAGIPRDFLVNFKQVILDPDIDFFSIHNLRSFWLKPSTIEKVGCFDERFICYCEDDDFWARARLTPELNVFNLEKHNPELLFRYGVFHYGERLAFYATKEDPWIDYDWRTKNNSIYDSLYLINAHTEGPKSALAYRTKWGGPRFHELNKVFTKISPEQVFRELP